MSARGRCLGWGVAALLAGCDGGGAVPPPPGPVGVPDATVPRPPPAREGPPSLRIWPGALTVREAGPAVALEVGLEGAFDGKVEVRVASPVVRVEPEVLSFAADGSRLATVRIEGPVDEDDADERGTVTLTPDRAGIDAESVPVRVVDAHLTVELVLDDAQLAFVASSNDKERRLDVGTVLDGRPGPRASINLRGKGTLRCPRRSFTVRFEDEVRLRSGPPLEDVLLLSMCLDEGFLKMRTSMELLAAEGLFPLWFRQVELRYGGETRGVYLMVERPRKGIPRAHLENTLVIRRLRDDQEELKRPREAEVVDRDALLAPYRALYERSRAHAGARRLAAMRAAMDYDGYLRWLAINSLLANGDYIDEVYFYDRAPPGGGSGPWFAVMAWDYDDIFNRCHTRHPIDDPLLYCAESALDRPVRDDPAVRAVYAAILERLIQGPLSDAAYGALLERAAAELAVYLRRPGVAAAMYGRDAAPDPFADAAALRARAAERRAAVEALLP